MSRYILALAIAVTCGCAPSHHPGDMVTLTTKPFPLNPRTIGATAEIRTAGSGRIMPLLPVQGRWHDGRSVIECDFVLFGPGDAMVSLWLVDKDGNLIDGYDTHTLLHITEAP